MENIPNALTELIKNRLSFLLGTDEPVVILQFLVKSKAKVTPEFDLVNDYSILEDMVMRELIDELQDQQLNLLWHWYNVGYFLEDTEIFIKTRGAYNESNDDLNDVIQYCDQCACRRV